MRHLSFIIAVLVSAGPLCAATYTRSTNSPAVWNNAATWLENDWPKERGDDAVFGVDAASVTQIDDNGEPSTASVIRAVLTGTGNVTLSRQTAVANTDDLVLVTNTSGAAHLVLDTASATSSTSPLNLNDTLRLRVDEMLIVSNAYGHTGRPIVLSCDFYGSGNVVCQGVGPIRFGFTAAGCEESVFTGAIHVRNMSSNGMAIFYSAIRAFTNSPNAKVVVHPTGLLAVQQSNSRCVLPIYMDGGRLTCNNMSNFVKDIIVRADCQVDAGGTGSVLTVEGTVSGTGTVARGSGGNGTVRYVGSIAPGFSAGTLLFNENSGTLQLGTASDRLALQIADGTAVHCSNMGAVVDLATMDVLFTTETAPATTNWFFSADSGISNTFTTVDFGPFTGDIIYDYAGRRAGAVVTPEPLGGLVLLGVMLAFRRMR
jgi:hypothetical protein